MSKHSLGWSCALVAVVGLAVNWQLVVHAQDDPFGGAANNPSAPAQRKPGKPATTKIERPTKNAEQRINAVLGKQLKTPLDYEGGQLNLVLEAISEEYGIPIIFDKAALDEVAISHESEVTVNLRNLSLRSALNLILKEPGLEDLTYVVVDEVLLITTEDKESLVAKVYRVDDLLDSSSPRFNSVGRYEDSDALIDIVISHVAHESWMKNGTGAGEIHTFPPGMLVISQTQRGHEHIEQLFAKLRSTKQQILAGAEAAGTTWRPATRGFAIQLNLGKDGADVRSRLATAIQKSVDWSSSKETQEEVWIEVLDDRVLVHHTPEVLEQVGIVLRDMRILPSGGGTSALSSQRAPSQGGSGDSKGGGYF